MTRGFDEAEYAALVHAFPPRPIRDEAQLRATEARIEDLLSQSMRTDAEEELLDLLANLVHEWESEHERIPPIGGVEVIRFLLEQRGLADRALTPVFGTASIISEVLARKRALQAKHIQKLADFFGVSPACFFPIAPDREADVA